MKKILMLLFSFGCCAGLFGQRTITGTVVDASDNNSPLPGVSIQIKGSSRGGATDLDGKFSLRLEADDKELVFTYLGMRAQTVAVGNLSLLHVRMEPDATVLGEVVVSALNIRREQRSLTAAQQRVNAETIAEVRDPNIVSSLAGKVAGVVVTPPTSSTGSARIVIRGNSSLTGNNQPLFVVDGMQIDNNDGSRGVNKNGGLDTGNGAADINPDDIESIDILKGPNAAALYGSRAVNGVILITTKRAQGGRFKVSVNSNAMMHYISQWPDFQNAFGVGHMSQMLGGNQSVFEQRDAAGNLYAYPGMPSMQKMLNNIATRSNGGPQIGQLYIGLDGQIHTYSPSPDNVYDFYQRAWAYTNNVSVEGGNADNNYRVSVTNYNANDVVANQNKVNKNTITGRFYNTLAKNLTLDSKITIVDDDTRNRRYANQSSFNPLYMYTIMPRTMTLDQLQHYKSDDGKETVRVGDIHNPYWTINETNNRDTKTRVMANFDLSYQIFPFLRANVKYAREFSNTRTTEFRNKGSLGGDDNNGSGYFRTQTNAYNNNMYEWMLLYNQRINDFSMIATLGGSQQNWKGSWQASSVVRLKQAGFAHLSNYDSPSDLNTDNGAVSHKRINSIYGSASVGYKDFIYLDITGRNDWSSTLPLTNCSYFYPSVGVSFIPSELFKIPSSVFYGKLRASYAQVGNDTDPYRLLPYVNFNSDNVFNNFKYASIDGTLPKRDLKPERTRSFEVGADLRFLNGRVNADITYYQKNSFDQIVEANMAPSSGYSRKVFNSGEIVNNGWEAALRFIPIETKDFSWDIDVNFTRYRSLVKSIIDGEDGTEIELGEVFSLKNVAMAGLPYGSMFGTVWLTDQQGRRMVNLTNGEPVRKENTYLGNFNPDYQFSISNRFEYRDFDLYVLVDMKKGGKLYSGTRRQAIRNGVISGLETAHESYWKREVIFGDTGDYRWGGVQFNDQGTSNFNNQNIYYYDPAMYDNIIDMNPIDPNYVPEQCTYYFWPGNVGYYADGYDDLVIYDASFIKLREISVGYNLPKKFIAKAKLSNARISVVGRNLWIFYQNTPKGLDPEAAMNAGNGQGIESGSLPPNTTFGVDLKLTF